MNEKFIFFELIELGMNKIRLFIYNCLVTWKIKGKELRNIRREK